YLYRTLYSSVFTFHDTPSLAIYTLSLHDALPICSVRERSGPVRPHGRRCAPRSSTSGCSNRAARGCVPRRCSAGGARPTRACRRSEEHTSELQSRENLVCRLLLEKKNDKITDERC